MPNNLNVFIVEDDGNIQKDIKILLSRRGDVNVRGMSTSIRRTVELLPQVEVDLVLMDIQLEDGKSFEILNRIDKIDFDVIFITAFDDYAIKAIKTGAIDYLLKPIVESELNEAIDRFKAKKRNTLAEGQRKILTDFLANNNQETKQIVVRTINEIYFIDTDNLMYCKGEGNYTTFFLNDGKQLTSSKPLREYVSILPASRFIKTHQSFIINKKQISCYRNSSELILKDNSNIPVSAKYKDSVIKKLTQ